MNQASDLVAQVIAACVADVYSTFETNDDSAVRYELGVAAESLIVQIGPAMGTTPEAIRTVLDGLYT